MNSTCLDRYKDTACFPCAHYRANGGNPVCDKMVLSFLIERCADYDYEHGSLDVVDDNGKTD